MAENACAFTGHRPHKLPWKYNEADPRCAALKETLAEQIASLAGAGVMEYFTGGADGVDCWAAEIILTMREKNPALKLRCVLPYEGQADKWSDSARERYHAILKRADSVEYVSRQYYDGCLIDRNHRLVESAGLLLAVFNGVRRSGTGATVNYGTEGRITLNVSKKALAVSNVDTQNRQYDGTSTVKITGVTLDGIVNGDTVSVSTANLTGTLNGSNVGSYTAVTLPALTLTGGGADNYTLTRPAGAVSTSVTISKATALTPKTGDLAVANNQAHTYTYGLGALRPDLSAGMSFGSSAVTYELGTVSLGSYYTGSGAKIEGQTLTLPIEAVNNDKAEGIGTITVTIKSDNFEDMTATINVRSVNKTIPTGAPTLSAATLTYGQPLSTITLRGDMAAGATPVPGKFEWSSPDNRPAVQEAYAAAWVFTPTDNNTYAIVNGTSTIKVVPASVAGAVVTLSPTSFRYDGQTHSPTVTSVKLGDTTLTADTDYTVEIPTETAAGTYTVTITGKGNYTGTAAATFTINPVETSDEFEDESGTTLRLEVETGLSTVPEALKNNAKYDTPAKIEAELRTQVEQVMSNVGENIAVFDVTLQYKDASGTWHTVDPDDFPTEGVTAILPYRHRGRLYSQEPVQFCPEQRPGGRQGRENRADAGTGSKPDRLRTE